MLGACEAHLHILRTDLLAGVSTAELNLRYGGLLATEELARQRRYLSEQVQRQYLLTRALVRTTLSRYASVDRRSWRFGADGYGRPFIAEPEREASLAFNVSNTEGLITCLVARIAKIGVDVEFVQRPVAMLQIADRFFSKHEAATLRGLPVAEQRERFFGYWTLKEAYIKARGMGLAIPLDAFWFDLSKPKIAMTTAAALADDSSKWQFWLSPLSTNHLCAVAIECDQNVSVALEQFEQIPPPA